MTDLFEPYELNVWPKRRRHEMQRILRDRRLFVRHKEGKFIFGWTTHGSEVTVVRKDREVSVSVLGLPFYIAEWRPVER